MKINLKYISWVQLTGFDHGLDWGVRGREESGMPGFWLQYCGGCGTLQQEWAHWQKKRGNE